MNINKLGYAGGGKCPPLPHRADAYDIHVPLELPLLILLEHTLLGIGTLLKIETSSFRISRHNHFRDQIVSRQYICWLLCWQLPYKNYMYAIYRYNTDVIDV